MGKPRHGLTDRDHLTGLGHGRGDHAVGAGLEVGIGKLIAGEIERAFGALETALRLVACRLFAIELGHGRKAAALERGVALLVGARLSET